MSAENKYCCMHIKTSAKIVGIIGLILSFGAACLSIFEATFISFALGILLTYILVLVGIHNKKPGLLFVAEIFLGVKVAIFALNSIALLLFAFLPQDNSQWLIGQMIYEMQNYFYHYYDLSDYGKNIRSIFLVSFAFSTVFMIWDIYSCIVIHRAREWFIRNSPRPQHSYQYVYGPQAEYPYGYGKNPMQIHVFGSSPFHHGPANPPGYFINAPHYPFSQNSPFVSPIIPTTNTPPQEG